MTFMHKGWQTVVFKMCSLVLINLARKCHHEKHLIFVHSITAPRMMI